MTGLEFSFLRSWAGWDEIDTGVMQFYNVGFRTDVGLPKEVVDLSHTQAVFILDISSSTIQVCGDDGEPVFESKVNLVLV